MRISASMSAISTRLSSSNSKTLHHHPSLTASKSNRQGMQQLATLLFYQEIQVQQLILSQKTRCSNRVKFLWASNSKETDFRKLICYPRSEVQTLRSTIVSNILKLEVTLVTLRSTNKTVSIWGICQLPSRITSGLNSKRAQFSHSRRALALTQSGASTTQDLTGSRLRSKQTRGSSIALSALEPRRTSMSRRPTVKTTRKIISNLVHFSIWWRRLTTKDQLGTKWSVQMNSRDWPKQMQTWMEVDPWLRRPSLL